jgi:hypothetical protein
MATDIKLPVRENVVSVNPTDAVDPISKGVVDVGSKHIFYYWGDPPVERFNFVALQRMNIHYLRKRILDETAAILLKGAMDDKSSDAVTALMRDYCTDRAYRRAADKITRC